ncbi:MAG TPA: AAA family ATPase [Terriglobia bacterium]|nr:AAA family ATPase [Terriglobia bacterium]
MAYNRLLKSIQLRNFLSYGPSASAVDLLPLNVVIGPNTSGKSNLLEAVDILRATPSDVFQPIRDGGGIEDYLWKGLPAKGAPTAEIEATIYYPEGKGPLKYRLGFTMVGQRFEIFDEVIENPYKSPGEPDVYFYYRYQSGHPVLNVRTKAEAQAGTSEGRLTRFLRREDVALGQSILSQRKDPDQYPEVTYLGNQFSKVRLYREWNLGRNTEPRKPQKVDLPSDFLSDSANNLPLVLNDLENRSETRSIVNHYLKKFDESAEAVTSRLFGGTIQLILHEKGLKEIPATRLSDGTLRYLCLLAVLCHPEPPPLVCVEEPEIGLHPDILPTVAELLTQASERSQLIVTTHSDTLVSALTESTGSVLVCERDADGSRLTRLDAEKLKDWLGKYRLGELWRMGELGGTRW